MWCYSQGDTKVDNKPSAVKTCKNPCECTLFQYFLLKFKTLRKRGCKYLTWLYRIL